MKLELLRAPSQPPPPPPPPQQQQQQQPSSAAAVAAANAGGAGCTGGASLRVREPVVVEVTLTPPPRWLPALLDIDYYADYAILGGLVVLVAGAPLIQYIVESSGRGECILIVCERVPIQNASECAERVCVCVCVCVCVSVWTMLRLLLAITCHAMADCKSAANCADCISCSAFAADSNLKFASTLASSAAKSFLCMSTSSCNRSNAPLTASNSFCTTSWVVPPDANKSCNFSSWLCIDWSAVLVVAVVVVAVAVVVVGLASPAFNSLIVLATVQIRMDFIPPVKGSYRLFVEPTQNSRPGLIVGVVDLTELINL